MENKSLNTAYFVAGIGIGVAIGILFAPKSGREMRELLAKKANAGADYLRSSADEMRNLVERSKQVISREQESISRAVRVGREAYRFDHPQPNGPSLKHASSGSATGSERTAIRA
jgi:gas vesicle protein